MPDLPSDPPPIRALFDENRSEANLAARQTLREADVIIGVDVTSGHQFPVYGRAAFERIARTGQTEWLRITLVPLNQETGDLERLLAVVQAVKGHHDYQGGPPEPAPAVQTTILPDGTLDTRTTDRDPYLAELRAKETAELQAALDALRQRGIPRPVVFTLVAGNAEARGHWDGVVGELRRRGTACYSTRPAGVDYVLTVEEARRVLRPFFGGDAHLRFRGHTWPLGYWTVIACRQGFVVMESRTPRDISRTEGEL
jgi:hypothetical protein